MASFLLDISPVRGYTKLIALYYTLALVPVAAGAGASILAAAAMRWVLDMYSHKIFLNHVEIALVALLANLPVIAHQCRLTSCAEHIYNHLIGNLIQCDFVQCIHPPIAPTAM